MDKVDKYREIIQQLIQQEYAGDRYTIKDVDRELIFDTKNHHYQIVNVGWEGDRCIYGCVLHFDIKEEKIWLQYNGTEIDFAEELVKAGVPHQDIVIRHLQKSKIKSILIHKLSIISPYCLLPDELLPVASFLEMSIGFHSPFMRQFTEYAVS
ncbi:MAG: XisI protein [Okeania sp. SIO2C2]|uniref:XisI protein n=1 Tax=Okeania sp. SIO2C2 TaxID=2607787 RepID=UPI0013BBF635|nr:XisI protein [Okeania sp. SIO2C2]NEP86000.1 XisI protein [Okeania sp. SIO2C2]